MESYKQYKECITSELLCERLIHPASQRCAQVSIYVGGLTQYPHA